MKYEPFDARFGAPCSLWKLLKTCDKRAAQNCPHTAFISACGTPALQKPILRETRAACEQIRFGQTIHISSNASV